MLLLVRQDKYSRVALNGASFPYSPPNRGTIEDMKGGSVYIEVKDNRLDGKFIEETTGLVTDNFTIFKDVNTGNTIVKTISPLDLPVQTTDLQILSPFGLTNSYTVSGPALVNPVSSTSGSISLTKPQIGPLYTVTEGSGCLSQKVTFQFDNNCWPASGVTINNIIDSPSPVTIRSLGNINGQNTIKSGSIVNYQAVGSVNLSVASGNMFHAMAGSVFSATRIAACP
jgi:hypothetical protein